MKNFQQKAQGNATDAQYVALNHADKIHTPQDDTDYKSAKIPESVTVEQLIAGEADISAATGNQQRF